MDRRPGPAGMSSLTANDESGNVAEGDKTAWNDMIGACKPKPREENWEKVQEMADVPAIIDYYLINIYTAMWDWPHNNWVAARERSESGRYRFYVWDAKGHSIGGDQLTANQSTLDRSLDSPETMQNWSSWQGFAALAAVSAACCRSCQ